ncbi:MAG: hypothetical protein B6240_11985 [Desulfobacteraceae bacterium 4572_87]|nr:MAG: hypothetical protein B6240_11985 [Desulfobacteraceae bacterium 4572_87]
MRTAFASKDFPTDCSISRGVFSIFLSPSMRLANTPLAWPGETSVHCFPSTSLPNRILFICLTEFSGTGSAKNEAPVMGFSTRFGAGPSVIAARKPMTTTFFISSCKRYGCAT